MKKYKWHIIILNLVLLLGYFNYSVIKKEKLLDNGQLVLLELAPVDPRSLMQGDYMALRYRISDIFDNDESFIIDSVIPYIEMLNSDNDSININVDSIIESNVSIRNSDFDAFDLPKRGYCVVRLDTCGVAKRVRFQKDISPLNDGEMLIKYNAPNKRNVNIGAESFFFQEGHAEKYEQAKYGGLKIDKNGNSLLIGLYDENKNKIE